jgi:hypothetical protein
MARLGPHTARRGFLEITTDSFNAIEEYIRWAEMVPRQFPRAMDILIRYMALTNLGIAQRMSGGPYDPTQSNKRVRRPIRKMSLRRTLDAMMRTQAYHRVWCEIYANPKNRPFKSRGFTQYVQSPGKGGFPPGFGLGTRVPG